MLICCKGNIYKTKYITTALELSDYFISELTADKMLGMIPKISTQNASLAIAVHSRAEIGEFRQAVQFARLSETAKKGGCKIY